MKLLVFTADPHTLICHRREILTDLAAQGWRITAAAAGPGGNSAKFMNEIGGRYRPLRMTRSGTNPLHDIQTYRDMRRLIRDERPDAVFAYTIKSVAYGCLAAAAEKVPYIYPLLCGLGYAFSEGSGLRHKIVSAVSERLYRAALRRASCVFLQNQDDLSLLTSRKILSPDTPIQIVAGSGVDLDAFAHTQLDMDSARNGRVRFVMACRMLRSKGVPEFIEAARRLRPQHPGWEFHLVGAADSGPDGIPANELKHWEAAGAVRWHGMQSDVRPLLRMAHAFVLPTSYREGIPRIILEALSMGRPVITTDSVGSRETITLTEAGRAQHNSGAWFMEGANGYLIRPKHSLALTEAMELFGCAPEAMQAMGAASRRLAVQRFDVRNVNSEMLARMVCPAPRAANVRPAPVATPVPAYSH